jgi:pre-rRNA-processing protein TSR3
MKILIYHAKQCNPRSCTSTKLKKFKLAQVFYTPKRIPRNSIVLNPLADDVLSKEDNRYLKWGLVALDCSWKRVAEVFENIRKPINSRVLPLLVAGNPVNYGKIGRLTTAESLASALYIMGYEKEGEKILSKFKWGQTFLNLNRELLDDYSKAQDKDEILKIQEELIETWRDSQRQRKGCSM